MDANLYLTIVNAIPLYVNETYLEREVREKIAQSIHDSLNVNCEHKWVHMSEVKLIDHPVCSKCGALKCKHN
jgi:hypothetical protein